MNMCPSFNQPKYCKTLNFSKPYNIAVLTKDRN